ncbi:MAG: ABC transporter ATP-binding protein [Bacillota bacterium]|nr:ABC transporter ATP-binding protein [Bacillota bacterium]
MLVFENVSKSFDQDVLKNLNFKLDQGQKLSIVGPSGRGKTTIFNLILGHLKADSGKIFVDFSTISTVYQENRLIEEISALDNLKFVSNKDSDFFVDLLASLEIFDPFQKVSDLSGGMKRRVAIARALAVDFDLLLLDEPIQGLDKEARDLVVQVIKNHIKDKAVILISHNQEDLKDFAFEILDLGCQ